VKPTRIARTTFCLASLVAVGTTLQWRLGPHAWRNYGYMFYFLFYSIFRTVVINAYPNTAAK
jgi:hypothetical protein